MFKNNDDVLNELKEQKESHLKMALEMGRIGSALVDIQKMMTKTLQTYTSENIVLQTYSQTFRANDYLYNSITVGDSAQNDNAKLIIDGIVPSYTIPLLAGINAVNIPDGATFTVSTTSGNPVTAVLTRYNTPGDNDTNVSVQGTVKMTDSTGTTFSAKNPADNTIIPAGNVLGVTAFNEYYNGATYDRVYNNYGGTLLASAGRTTAPTTPIQTNYNARGVMLILNVTAASGTGGLQVTLQDSNNIWLRTPGNDIAPVTAVGVYGIICYPGVTDFKQATPGTLNVIQKNNSIIPRNWQVQVQVGDATSYTYSLTYAYIL